METDYAREMVERGFSFVTIASDARLLASAAKAAVDAMRASGGAQGAASGSGTPQAGY
jgi:4-hydroxy-2-oxoheptanedioate aldolase